MKTAFASVASFLLAAPLMAQTAAPASPEAPAKAANIWQLAVSGGPMVIPLAALSVITVMLIVVFVFTLRRGAMVSGATCRPQMR